MRTQYWTTNAGFFQWKSIKSQSQNLSLSCSSLFPAYEPLDLKRWLCAFSSLAFCKYSENDDTSDYCSFYPPGWMENSLKQAEQLRCRPEAIYWYSEFLQEAHRTVAVIYSLLIQKLWKINLFALWCSYNPSSQVPSSDTIHAIQCSRKQRLWKVEGNGWPVC